MALTEIKLEERRLVLVRSKYYRGRRFLMGSPSSAPADAIALIGTDFPDMPAGEDAPKACRFDIKYKLGGDSSRALVILDYETSLIGKGLISIVESQSPYRVYKDAAGVTFDGPAADGMHHHRLLTGTNVLNSTRYMMRIDTSYAAASVAAVVADMMALTGNMYNANAFTSFITVDAKTLRWAGSRRLYHRADEFPFVFFLEYNPDTWENTLTSRKGVWVTENRTIYVDGSETEETVPVIAFHWGQEITEAGVLQNCLDTGLGAGVTAHTIHESDSGKMDFIDDLTMFV